MNSYRKKLWTDGSEVGITPSFRLKQKALEWVIIKMKEILNFISKADVKNEKD